MRTRISLRPLVLAVALLGAAAAPFASAACGDGEEITVYSGRSQELIGPLLEQFADETGIDVRVRYGSTALLAATLIEEGDATPADVYIAQDAGALGAVEAAGLFAPLPQELLERVAATYRSSDGRWVGLSGRARVIVYNTDALSPEDLPDSILDFTDPKWRGRLGWAPANGSFQAWVTALRVTHGEDAAREWLEGMIANDIATYPNNVAITEAVGRGEIDAGFVNHYYLYRFLAEQGEGFGARNYYTAPGDIGTLVNVAGAGVLAASDHPELAEQLLDFMLSEEAQRYYADETHEYPLVAGVDSGIGLPPIADLEPVELDLGRLDDLEGTLELLRDVGALP